MTGELHDIDCQSRRYPPGVTQIGIHNDEPLCVINRQSDAERTDGKAQL
jgi:hypothetical protein